MPPSVDVMAAVVRPYDGRKRWRPAASMLVVAVYALASWLILRPLPLADNTQMPNCACVDPAQQVWFIALSAAQLTHHHLSLFTRMADYPTGANLLVNTSMPLLGWFVSPITLWLGPVAAYDVACRLALFLSAWAGFFLLRRFHLSRFPATLGGLLYGFSPYMFDQGGLHLFLMFVPLPPLMIAVVYRQLEGSSLGSTIYRGALLAAMAVAQFLICSEILVTTALVVTLTLVCYGAALAIGHYRQRRPQLLAAASRLAALSGAAVMLAGPPLGWAAHYALAGPQVITGSTKGTSAGVNWANIFLPVDNTELLGRLLPLHSSPVLWFENGGLIGIPLLVVAGLTVAYRRRDHRVAAAACGVVLAWLLSLGAEWELGLPVLEDVMANRLALYCDLGVAVLVAAGTEHLLAARRAAGSRRWWPALGVIGTCLALASLAPWPPAAPVASTGEAQLAARYLDRAPPGTTVLSYPYPRYIGDQAMLWQALGGMRNRLLGGYLLRPNAKGNLETRAAALNPNGVPVLFQRIWLAKGFGQRLLAAARDQLPSLVRRYRVGVLVVDTGNVVDRGEVTPGRLSRPVVALVTEVYGPPLRVGHFDVWYPHTTGSRAAADRQRVAGRSPNADPYRRPGRTERSEHRPSRQLPAAASPTGQDTPVPPSPQ